MNKLAVAKTTSAKDELTEVTIFNQFGKGKELKSSRTNNCVIYTRVSSREQELGYSLDTQRKDCEEFARKNNYSVLGFFGGTYESAKTDERKEFNRMLQFCKRSKEKITYIVVHMVDRFSRSGANAIYIKDQLKSTGIYIMSVKQPVDVTTSSGDFQQNIQIIFSHYDNQVRREKCVAGILEALNRGEWCHAAPRGYDSIKINGKRKLVVNAEGKLLRKAFLWKANEGISNEECMKRLNDLGMKIINQSMSNIFKNPFYCGLMAHNLLEGKLVDGNHEKLISKEIFLKVNDLQNKNPHGYKVDSDQGELPLKLFFRCKTCGNGLTGYMVKKKKIWYYKCRIKGCCNNKSVKDLHEKFDEIISHFTLQPEFLPLLKEQMLLTIESLNKENEANSKRLKADYEDLNRKIERTEERYMNEEIAQDLFVKYAEKYKLERLELLRKMRESESSSSNHEDAVDLALNYAVNLTKMWHSGDFIKKQRLQYFLFPEGLTYNKQNDEVRTTKYNSVFLWIAYKQKELEGNKKGIVSLGLDYPTWVVPTGIEPVTQGFSVLCSTN